jgi:hypothetical protein
LRNQLLGGNRGVFEIVGYAAVEHDLTVMVIKLQPQRRGCRNGIVAPELDQSNIVMAVPTERNGSGAVFVFRDEQERT